MGKRSVEVSETHGLLNLHLAGGTNCSFIPSRIMLWQASPFSIFLSTILKQSWTSSRKKAVRFERYEGDLKTDEKGVLRGGDH